ncbi:MAG: hypothetical protein KDJ35_04315 [Alphaproteobacteria bacterium]|nr:hypothetical protein [Alphaproteobacteria bacterium]
MFWLSKEKKADKAAKKKEAHSQKLREEALANARAARENIGDETLQRIAAAMTAKQQSNTEQAKRAIQNADAERVAQELLQMIKDNN